MADEVKAKGLNFVYFRDYVTENQGAAFWSDFLQNLPEEDQHIWKGAILSAWYPFKYFKTGFFEYARLMGTGNRSKLPKVYEYIAEKSLNTIYKVFFKVAASPTFVLKNYPKLWSLFFNTGSVEILETGDKHCTFRFTLPEIFLDWLGPACTG
ncbi:MAG TPA: hypothetical protein VLB09_04005, partial [Nitrospiria bacterium]|nr:hypothetical protein [Nitrospiria bacterium]